jgi:sulfatase maturation enzyme AslB (radical SAM superfamily)
MNKDTYCHYPFKAIAIKDYKGDKLRSFWPCCMMGNDRESHNINALEVKNPHLLTPQEMFDHPRMEELRNNLSNGIRDSACKTCWDQEDRGLKSFRHFSNDEYNLGNNGLELIDITASNICNLRCRMCSPTSSNLLMKDVKYFKNNGMEKEAHDVLKRWAISEPLRATESIQWDWLMQNTHKIKVLKASGGEPFYDNKVIQLLNRYVETGAAKNTYLSFHTNATQFTTEIVDLINHFKQNKHTFSIDGTDKVYEYIRYPANFKEMELSVINYINNVKNYDPILNFTMVVSAHNVLNIPEYIEWAKHIYPGVSIHFAEIYDMDRGIALKHMPIQLLEYAKSQVTKHIYRASGREDGHVLNLIRQIDLAISNNNENKELLKNETVLFDMSRDQSYRDFLHPDLVSWLDNE